MNEKTSMVLFKIGHHKFLSWLYGNGNVSFSCGRNFVNQAALTHNDEQGDEQEGVFARLSLGDSRINEMKMLLGCDLEIINDSPYVLLRRFSSGYIPIYCLYSISKEIFSCNISNGGDVKVRHDIPQLIFENFTRGFSCANVLSDDYLPASVAFRSESFITALDCELYKKGIKRWRSAVNYDLKSNETYFIEPTTDYNELFYKRKKYEYQQEARYILPEMQLRNSDGRLNIFINIKSEDKCLVQGPPPYMIFHGQAIKYTCT